MSKHPHFGHTKLGLAVHARTIDHSNAGKFNKAIAVLLTARVGNMRCFWYFCALAVLSLPATLHEAGVVGSHWLGIPSFFMSFGFIFLDAWVCQNFIQLVLLPALMVGQNLQSAAADARSAKQFEDTEQILTLLKQMDAHDSGLLDEIHRHVTALAPDAGDFPPPPEPAPSQVKIDAPVLPNPRKLRRPGGDRM